MPDIWNQIINEVESNKGIENQELLDRLDLGTEGNLRRDGLWFVRNIGVHNGKDGSKLWWGDLDAADLIKIQSKLKPGEVIFILDQHSSFWNFTTVDSNIQRHTDTDSESIPGLGYVISTALFAITPESITYIDPIIRRRIDPEILGSKTLYDIIIPGWIDLAIKEESLLTKKSNHQTLMKN